MTLVKVPESRTRPWGVPAAVAEQSLCDYALTEWDEMKTRQSPHAQSHKATALLCVNLLTEAPRDPMGL
jgi:hypothetical protein